jgi:hypothetical protein
MGIKVYSGDSGTFQVSSDGVYSLSPALSDAISILQLLSGASSARLTDAVDMMDINGDGKIGLPEAICILQRVAGMR